MSPIRQLVKKPEADSGNAVGSMSSVIDQPPPLPLGLPAPGPCPVPGCGCGNWWLAKVDVGAGVGTSANAGAGVNASASANADASASVEGEGGSEGGETGASPPDAAAQRAIAPDAPTCLLWDSNVQWVSDDGGGCRSPRGAKGGEDKGECEGEGEGGEIGASPPAAAVVAPSAPPAPSAPSATISVQRAIAPPRCELCQPIPAPVLVARRLFVVCDWPKGFGEGRPPGYRWIDWGWVVEEAEEDERRRKLIGKMGKKRFGK